MRSTFPFVSFFMTWPHSYPWPLSGQPNGQDHPARRRTYHRADL